MGVYSDNATSIELVSTFSGFDDGFNPNPSTIQVISFKKENYTLKFNTDYDNTVSLESLEGKSKIYWEFEKENVFYLGGREESLSIVLTSDIWKQKDCNFIINNLEPDLDDTNDDKPGFSFLISYFIRVFGLSELIFEELQYGKSREIDYRKTRFPFILYCQLPDKEYSVNIYSKTYCFGTEFFWVIVKILMWARPRTFYKKPKSIIF